MNIGYTFVRAVVEALHIGFVVLVTVLIDPQRWFPTVPAFVINCVTAIVLAFAWALLRLFGFPRAHLTVRWMPLDRHRELREVDLNIDSTTRAGEKFLVDVRCERAWGFGWLALWWATRQGLWIRTRSPHSRLALIADSQPNPNLPVTVRERPGFEVQIQLKPDIPKPDDDWNEVIVQSHGMPLQQGRRRGLKHSPLVEGRLGGICAWFIKVDSKAINIIEQRS